MAIFTHDDYEEFLKNCEHEKTMDKCDFCGRGLKRQNRSTRWQYHGDGIENEVVVYWKESNAFVFHPECAMEMALNLISDTRSIKSIKD